MKLVILSERLSVPLSILFVCHNVLPGWPEFGDLTIDCITGRPMLHKSVWENVFLHRVPRLKQLKIRYLDYEMKCSQTSNPGIQLESILCPKCVEKGKDIKFEIYPCDAGLFYQGKCKEGCEQNGGACPMSGHCPEVVWLTDPVSDEALLKSSNKTCGSAQLREERMLGSLKEAMLNRECQDKSVIIILSSQDQNRLEILINKLSWSGLKTLIQPSLNPFRGFSLADMDNNERNYICALSI